MTGGGAVLAEEKQSEGGMGTEELETEGHGETPDC